MATTDSGVFVVGSLHLDVVVNAPHLPAIDETVIGRSVSYSCGGKGGNQAIASAQHGVRTAMAGCIGSDDAGTQLRTNLQQHSVDCTQLQCVDGASGMSVAVVDANGDYGAVIVSAANLLIDTTRICIPPATSVVMLQNEIPESVNEAVAAAARHSGAKVMLNAAPYRDMPDALLDKVDLLVLNRVEAASLFAAIIDGVSDAVALLQRASYGHTVVVITLGAEGLVYRDLAGQVLALPAQNVDVRSTHGAGDRFCGALASSLASGHELSAALQGAQCSAANWISRD